MNGIVELSEAGLVIRDFGMLVRDSIVHTDPLVSMVVRPHAIVQHRPSLLDELRQESARTLVLGVLVDVTHQKDDLLAHDGALDSGTAVVQQVSLVFLDGLLYPVV